MKTRKTACEGEWDFSGAWAPKEDGSTPIHNGQQTFSLGCFQWVKAKSGGLKQGKIMWRVKGQVSEPRSAHEAARAYCAKRNALAAKGNGAETA